MISLAHSLTWTTLRQVKGVLHLFFPLYGVCVNNFHDFPLQMLMLKVRCVPVATDTSKANLVFVKTATTGPTPESPSNSFKFQIWGNCLWSNLLSLDFTNSFTGGIHEGNDHGSLSGNSWISLGLGTITVTVKFACTRERRFLTWRSEIIIILKKTKLLFIILY